MEEKGRVGCGGRGEERWVEEKLLRQGRVRVEEIGVTLFAAFFPLNYSFIFYSFSHLSY